MKSSLGKTLRKIRKGKNISLDSIADEHLSKSQISRFERGESEISCIRLLNLLNKLKVSAEEFFALHNSQYNDKETFESLVTFIRKQYTMKNFNNIKNLLSPKSIFPINSFEKTMIKSIIYSFDSLIKPTKNELLELTDYLFKVENWGYYEIILLGNCIRTIEYSTLFLLTKEMLENLIYLTSNTTNKKLVTQLSINCLIISIDNNFFNDSTYLISKIKQLLNNELNYYEQTVFLYAKGYFDFKNQIKSGKMKMKQAIYIFEILEEKTIMEYYSEHYKKYVEKKA
jgi:transcriptional activator, rgg/gadR/mutR family, C-terminal domain